MQSSKNNQSSFNLKQYQIAISNGEFARVISELDEALVGNELTSSEISQSLYLQAVAYRFSRQAQEALVKLELLEKAEPTNARMHQEKGYNFRILGNLKEAAKSFYQATQLNPALLSAWQALLPIYKAQNQQKALTLCETQVAQLSELPKPVLAATELMYDGKLDDADLLVRRFLQQHKHNKHGLILLADIAIKLKAISEAEFILETCAELHKDDLPVKYQLFKVYSKLGKFENALQIANQLAKASPNNLFYQVALATATQGVGNIEKALEILIDINQQHGEQAQVNLLLGHAYKTNGNTQKSIAAYQQAYKLEPSLGDAFWSLANIKTYQFSNTEIVKMQKATESPNVSKQEKIYFHFALGKAYEDAKEYKDSYHHYRLGNEQQHELTPFNIESHTKFVEHQKKQFTPEFYKKLMNKGCSNSDPIFILGMPRAGSTLLEQILASHSQVDGTMELHEILGLAAKLSKKHANTPSYPENLCHLPEGTLAKLGEDFIKKTNVYRDGAPYFIDKMPNNYMHVGLIKTILPNAKIIDARRSPMACCFSGYKQLFGDGQEFSYDLKTIGLYYQNYISLMEHWHTVFPGQILQIDNEAIIDDTETQIRKMLDFCGLEFEESCMHFYKNTRAVKTPSAQQVRQPIYSSGKNQWENYKEYLGELIELFD